MDAVTDDGGLVRADLAPLARAATVAEERGISVYDAAYAERQIAPEDSSSVAMSATWTGEGSTDHRLFLR